MFSVSAWEPSKLRGCHSQSIDTNTEDLWSQGACSKITQLGNCRWDLNSGLRSPQDGGQKNSEFQEAGKQFIAQGCSRRKGLNPPPRSSAQPNGQSGILGRSCPLPGLGHLLTALPGTPSSVIHLPAAGNPSLDAPAQPGAWGHRERACGGGVT
jgi:hypothetical protein